MAFPTPNDRPGQGPAESIEAAALEIRIRAIFPPATLGIEHARQVAAFADPCAPQPWLAGQLSREPKPKSAFLILAFIVEDAGDGERAIGYLKLQHDAHQVCRIHQLVVDPLHRRRGLGGRLVRHAWSTLVPHEQLAVAVSEDDTAAHLFLRSAGLECGHPAGRTKRQADRREYEFRSVVPEAKPFRGVPRFTWPRPDLSIPQ